MMTNLLTVKGPQIHIYIDQIKANVHAFQRETNRNVMAVIKANAYGLGVENILPALIDSGVKRVAVFSVEEGAAVRDLNNDLEILLLRAPYSTDINAVVANRITPTFANDYELRAFDAACKAMGLSHKVPVALFFNTGMNWFGRKKDMVADAELLMAAAQNAIACRVTDVCSHLPNVEADNGVSDSDTQFHIDNFRKLVALYSERLPDGVSYHIANSQGALSVDQSDYTDVRIGKGLNQDACQLCTSILEICHLRQGDKIGYSGEYVADSDCKIAVLEMGYADGLSTHYQGTQVEIDGVLYPIVGRVAMDVCYAKLPKDATVSLGTMAVFFGPMTYAKLSKESFAKSMNMNVRQVTCILGDRVKRVLI